MSSGTVMPVPQQQFLDLNGDPFAAGTLDTYEAGTTTPLATYSDSALTVANANPVVLDAAGRATVYLLPQSYKFVLKDSSAVEIYTQDNVLASAGAASTNLELTGTAGEAVSANNLCYLSDGSGGTAGRWFKADADLDYAGSDPQLAFATAAIASGADGLLRINGTMDGFTGLSAGTAYYVSGTAAAITSTKPTQARFVGRAISATTLLLGFSPARVALEQPRVCEGRLTLTTGTPVTTADVTAATSVFFTPYTGNLLALFDTSRWVIRKFPELEIDLGSDTANKPYDIFAYDNDGVVAIERLVWTNDTTRATALVLQDGVLVKTGATDRRYLGSYRTTSAAGQTESSFARRLVSNYYNQVDLLLRAALETANSYTYTTATLRQANNNTANQVDVMVGVAENTIRIEVLAQAQNSTPEIIRSVAIGQSSTSAKVANSYADSASGEVNERTPMHAVAVLIPAAGYHYFTWLEQSTATGACTWVGDNGDASTFQSGISGIFRG